MNKIAFYCDFGKIYGHGHFSRQLNLYKSLSKKINVFLYLLKNRLKMLERYIIKLNLLKVAIY